MKNWRKITIRLLILLTAFFAGIFSFYFITSDNKVIDTIYVINPTSVQVPENLADIHRPPGMQGIIPCSDNELFSPNLDWIYQGKPISLGNVNKKIVCGVLPEYPQALKAEFSGVVTVYISIGFSGEVTSASLVSKGNSQINTSALLAAKQTRFIPVLRGGKTSRAIGILVYEFDGVSGVRLQGALLEE